MRHGDKIHRQTGSRDDSVKSYVLRYWEDELDLRIQRNELGHRYYTDMIFRFYEYKELKKRGLQLRAIKDLIPSDCPYNTRFLQKAA